MGERASETARRRRGRGSRAGLTRERILEAARGLDPAAVTVKAVADRLGVDRAAVHHHIADLETLRQLVARDVFTVRLAPVVIPPDADWREACRLLAESMYDAVLASGGFGVHIRLSPADIALLEPVEHTLRIMTAAGFDDETAARSLAALAALAGAIARERQMDERATGHPQLPALRHTLEDDRGDALPILRRIAETELDTFGDTQLRTGIDLLIDGMAARLPPAGAAGEEAHPRRRAAPPTAATAS